VKGFGVSSVVLWYRNVYPKTRMRPRVNIGDETRERVEEYAREHGFTVPRAYAELLNIGLEATAADE